MPNTIVKEVGIKQILPDIKNFASTAYSWSQGDHAILDTTNHVVRAPTAEAEGAYYLGIQALDVEDGKPLSPYQGTAVDAAQAIPSMNGPLYGMTAKFILKTGDSLNPGDNVYIYLAAGSRGVGSLSGATGTKAIGVYEGAAISGAAANTEIEVLVGARAPNDVLKF